MFHRPSVGLPLCDQLLLFSVSSPVLSYAAKLLENGNQARVKTDSKTAATEYSSSNGADRALTHAQCWISGSVASRVNTGVTDISGT